MITRTVRVVALSLFTTLSAVTPALTAQAQVDESWSVIGKRTVDEKLDKDVITAGKADGSFTAIRINVEGSALVMLDIKVVFGNGEVFEPKTRLVFEKDTKSRVIDLPGNTRTIRRVEFKYGNLPKGGRAHVTLSGRR